MKLGTVIRDFFSSKKTKENAGERVVYYILIATVFLIPIFFLPSNSFPVEFNKVLLFSIFVLLATTVYGIGGLMRRSFMIVRTPIDWWLVGFVGLYLVSFIFSQDRYSSLVGIGSQLSGGIVTVISLVLFVFLVVQHVRRSQQLIGLLVSFVSSLGIAFLFTVLQLNELYIFSAAATQVSVFNPLSNSIAIVGMMAVIGILVAMGLVVSEQRHWLRRVFVIFMFLFGVVAYMLGAVVPLYIIGSATLALLFFAVRQAQHTSRWTVITPAAVIVVSIILIVLSATTIGPDTASERISLGYSTSLSVATSSAFHSPLWGSGPQTFSYDFNLYRPASFNDTDLWTSRFVKGASQWSDVLGTTGFGVIAALIGIIFILSRRVASIIRERLKAHKDWMLILSLFVTWVTVLVMGFIYPYTMVLQLSWWLLTGLLLYFVVGEKMVTTKVAWSGSKRNMIVVYIISGIIFIMTAGVLFFGGRAWVADYYYVQAQQQIRNQDPFTVIASLLEKAIDYNPYESKYYIRLAQGNATQAQLVASQPEGDVTVLQQYAQEVIDNSNSALEAQPDNLAVYDQVVALYDGLRNIISNVDELSLVALEKAVVLEPNNAFTWLNVGRSRVLYAQSIIDQTPELGIDDVARDLLHDAITDFNTAKDLKKDFLVADFNIALTYQILAQPDQAITHLTATVARYPEQPDVLYTLATLHYEAGDLEKALQWYDQVVVLTPSYSGVYWQRSFIYETQGNLDAAIGELEILLRINPENVQAQERLQLLRTTE